MQLSGQLHVSAALQPRKEHKGKVYPRTGHEDPEGA